MIITDLRQITDRVGGEVRGLRAYVPGPGHSRKDRSLAVWLCSTTPLVVMTHSFAGDPWPACNDYLAAAVGAGDDYWRTTRRINPAETRRRDEERRKAEVQERAEAEWRHRRMTEMWLAARDPRGTAAADYYRSRGLGIDDEIAGSVLRFHPRARFGDAAAPTILAALRDIGTGKIRGLHRTALDDTWRKVGRKMFGVAMGCAVMLDRLDPVNGFLVVGEGIETVQTARQHLGLRPAWALGSSGAIGALPVLDGVHTLIVLGENDANGASERAVQRVGERWHDAGRNVEILWPPEGAKDLNDTVREDAAACQ